MPVCGPRSAVSSRNEHASHFDGTYTEGTQTDYTTAGGVHQGDGTWLIRQASERWTCCSTQSRPSRGQADINAFLGRADELPSSSDLTPLSPDSWCISKVEATRAG